jgi:hypothetical protein
VAICTPVGPRIFPVNYVCEGGDSIVFRTSPSSTLGTFAWGTEVAFQVDELDWTTSSGWSVEAVGRPVVVHDPVEIAELRGHGEPHPWAGGSREMFIRLRWKEIAGRSVGTAPLPQEPRDLRPADEDHSALSWHDRRKDHEGP